MPVVVAALGDSITARAFSAAGGNPVLHTGGYAYWAGLFLGDAFERPVLDFGSPGDTTADCLARVGAVSSAAPDVCVVMAGTNDLPDGGADAASVVNDLRAIYTALKLAGISTVAITVPPRDDIAAGREAVRQEINAWIKAAASTYLVDTLIDIETVVGSGGRFRPGHGVDGVHPSAVGAYRIGRALAEALQPRVSLPPVLPFGAAALVENGALLGSGGTLEDVATGDVADGWTLKSTASNTLALLGEKEPHPSVVADRQVIKLFGTAPAAAADGAAVFVQNVTPTLSPGAVVQLAAEFSVRAADNVSDLILRVQFSGDATVRGTAGASLSPPEPLPRDAWDATIRTPFVTVPTNPTNLNMFVEIRPIAGAEVVCEIALSSFRLEARA